MHAPDNGPMLANNTSVGLPPLLSVSTADSLVKIVWKNDDGNDFDLEETSDLSSGDWKESYLPFEQVEINGEITITADVDPVMYGPVKFYRLVLKP